MTPRPPDAFLSLRSDEQLVRLVHGGNERAFVVMVERYRRELHAFAGRMRADGRADDLVQQTFLSAFTALRAGTEVKHLRGWLYRILRNEATRASSRTVVEVELDPTSVASEPLEEASQRRMLAFEALSSIAALPDRQRDVLVASALNGESRAAVAGSMGLSEGAVRQLMHRARATLRAAAAAITPAPLANWMGAFRNGPVTTQVPEIAIGASSAPAAGIALKLGAILASGALATGIVGSQIGSPPKHRPVLREHARPAPRSAQAAAAASAGSGREREGDARARVTRVNGRNTAAVAVGVLHPAAGAAGRSSERLRGGGHHTGSASGEGGDGGGGSSGPSRASAGHDGARTREGGGTGQGSGVDDGPVRNGGSVSEPGTGSDGGGTSGSGSTQSVAEATSMDGGSEGPTSGGDSGSTSSGGGGGRDSSGDAGSGGTDSGGGQFTSSSDLSGLSTRTRDSSGSDSSGK